MTPNGLPVGIKNGLRHSGNIDSEERFGSQNYAYVSAN
jgi:hypothetical protein